jgi:hypothetical protein
MQTTLNSLPDDVQTAMQPLLADLPIAQAMKTLVVDQPAGQSLLDHAERAAADPALADHPPLLAGLWLYVDELDRSHTISQQIASATGAYWHGIMHRREGDFSNSHYWFRKVGEHPAMADIGFDYDPHRFVDEVATIAQGEGDEKRAVDIQQREWAALFTWCAHHR